VRQSRALARSPLGRPSSPPCPGQGYRPSASVRHRRHRLRTSAADLRQNIASPTFCLFLSKFWVTSRAVEIVRDSTDSGKTTECSESARHGRCAEIDVVCVESGRGDLLASGEENSSKCSECLCEGVLDDDVMPFKEAQR